MIPCPRCGGTNAATLIRPRAKQPRVARGIVVRHHKCPDCGMDFRSFQLAVEDRAVAESIMDAVGAA
jgi:hypothetical protein